MSTEREASIRRLYQLRVENRSNELEMKEIIESLGITEAGSEVVGDYILKATPTARFDAATARANLSAAKFKAICESVPTSAKAKKVLGSDEYAKTQKVSGWTVKAELPEVDR